MNGSRSMLPVSFVLLHRLLLSCHFMFYPSLMLCITSLPVPQNRQPPHNVRQQQIKSPHQQLEPTTQPYTLFQFDLNGTCIVPKFFVASTKKGSNCNKHINSNNEQQQEKDRYFTMQNVPGDGDCMFLAVAFAAKAAGAVLSSSSSSVAAADYCPDSATIPSLYDATKSRFLIDAEQTAFVLRTMVADTLEMENHVLFVSQNRTIETQDLLNQASMELNRHSSNTQTEAVPYCTMLRRLGSNHGLYGGGPELTVLCNLYERPIHVYEMDYTTMSNNRNIDGKNNSSTDERLLCMHIIEKGVFGDGVYDIDDTIRNSEHATIDDDWDTTMQLDLHILVIDVADNEKHACVLLPTHPPTTTTFQQYNSK